ncbi:porin family protein [Spirosoma sp. SC4-14]|uniref:porin family protein n=1 Tax=Spirosoma sp. SC4-14 TaxID=3128900 RepID=UPI0030CD6BE9
MNNLLPLLALLIVPLGVSAQTKTLQRKPVVSQVRKTTQPVQSTTTPKAGSVSRGAALAAPTTGSAQQASAMPVQQSPAVTPAPKPVTVVATPQPARPVAIYRQSESRFRIGFRVGGNFSTIGGVDASAMGEGLTLKRVAGFHGGVVMNIGGPSFSVQPELLYTQYGIRMAFGADYLQLKYNLVEVPVLLKASFGQPELRFFINAGPVGAYTLSGSISVRESGQSQSQVIDMTGQGRFSYGAAGGAGVAMKMGTGTILVEGRYSYLFSSNDDGTSLTPQNAMLSVGYLIPLSGH